MPPLRVIVPSAPVTPGPLVGVCPLAMVSAGQIPMQPLVHRLTPGLSLSKLYRVWPLDAATRMVPIAPTVWASTNGAADGEGVGVAVGVAEGEGDGVAVAAGPVAWPPHAASIRVESMTVSAAGTVAVILI